MPECALDHVIDCEVDQAMGRTKHQMVTVIQMRAADSMVSMSWVMMRWHYSPTVSLRIGQIHYSE